MREKRFYQGYSAGSMDKEVLRFHKVHGRDPENITELVTWLYTEKYGHKPAELIVTQGCILAGPQPDQDNNGNGPVQGLLWA